jgi:hypothetical protein
MKNVELFQSSKQVWRVAIEGLPPLAGWAVQYVSGADPNANPPIEEGYWLSQWDYNKKAKEATFSFEPDLHMCFNEESYALAVSDALWRVGELETRVVKIEP